MTEKQAEPNEDTFEIEIEAKAEKRVKTMQAVLDALVEQARREGALEVLEKVARWNEQEADALAQHCDIPFCEECSARSAEANAYRRSAEAIRALAVESPKKVP